MKREGEPFLTVILGGRSNFYTAVKGGRTIFYMDFKGGRNNFLLHFLVSGHASTGLPLHPPLGRKGSKPCKYIMIYDPASDIYET